tara:strand:+ start:2164 stop:2559 length:396 start_codon:yes stop_codon:yes gene_type:complete
MNWKYTLVGGAGTGSILALFIALIMVKIGVEPPSFSAALALFIAMILLSAFIVNKMSNRVKNVNLNMKHLVSISFLTFFMPLLGISFGAPNSEFLTLAKIVIMGTLGGLFWALPFALWVQRSSGSRPVEEE